MDERIYWVLDPEPSKVHVSLRVPLELLKSIDAIPSRRNRSQRMVKLMVLGMGVLKKRAREQT